MKPLVPEICAETYAESSPKAAEGRLLAWAAEWTDQSSLTEGGKLEQRR
jgi:hypothetical protein